MEEQTNILSAQQLCIGYKTGHGHVKQVHGDLSFSLRKGELTNAKWADVNFTEDEYNIIISNDWQNSINVEVKARCCDILKKREKDKRAIIL